jgi:hypothetical protein
VEARAVQWYDAADEYERRTAAQGGRLASLSAEWQRELVALGRAHRDIFNGGYLQFLVNGGRESYVYASRALKKIGAHRMADLIDRCQSLVDRYFPSEGQSQDELQRLMPNTVLDPQGNIMKEAGSVLPEAICEQISELSYEFMDLPDDTHSLAQNYYGAFIEADKPA